MRLEQELRDNLKAAAAAVTVPEPRRAPSPKTPPGWRRPLAFAAGAVAAVALIGIPALIISLAPSGTTLAPFGATSVESTMRDTVPSPTTTVVDLDRVVMADEPSGDHRLLLVAERDTTEVDPPLATVRLSVPGAGGEGGVEVVVGEPGSFFWNTVSEPGGVCQLSALSIDGGVRVVAQILLSASAGCSEPYLFDLVEAEGSLSPVNLTAEDMAQIFVKAWLSGSQQAMESMAGPEALAQAEAIEVEAMSGEGVCEGAAGSLYCTWEIPEGRLTVRVSNAGFPPRVEEVRLEPAVRR